MPLSAPTARRQAGADPYQWLEQRDAPEVLAYLDAENAWLTHCMAAEAPLREALFHEIRARIRETDLSLPRPLGGWLYYSRTTAGDEYACHYRCPRTLDDALAIDATHEQCLLNLNTWADGGHLELGDFSVSPDHRWLAFSLDRLGDETFELWVLDMHSGSLTELPFDACDGSLTWANDSQTLFFVTLDETHRPYQVHRHRLGDSDASLVFEESDGRFFVSCQRASSEQQLIVLSASKTTTEAWILDANQPEHPFQCIAPREEGHEYYPDHGLYQGQSCWLIRSNQDSMDFALYRAPETPLARAHWQMLIAPQAGQTLEHITLNACALLLERRENGLPVIDVVPAQGSPYRIQLPDAAYSLHVSDNLEFHSPCVRLRYEALNRPAQIRALDLLSGTQIILRETPVEGSFNPDDFLSLRLWASSADGTRIPISLVGHRAALAQQKPAPLYLYGYGAYGESLDPWFSHARLSLLERGFLFAIAHVRGGGELGEAWYHAGKLAHKHNTFDDFIACSTHLIESGYTESNRLVISGGSAGGLLIGAVLNQRPDLFAAAVAEVPFVDVLNTMQNPDLPLTVTEYDEWGDPHQPDVQARLRAYAPYENVREQPYPALLVVAGYHDTRVQYWEAAKWVAKLRATRRNAAPLLLHTVFDAGHAGLSGRYQAMREAALEYAFLLKVLGMHTTT